MQTLRTQLQAARLVLMKRRAAKYWAKREQPSAPAFDASLTLTMIDLLRLLHSLPNAIEGELAALRMH
jgi:hypothetical protein